MGAVLLEDLAIMHMVVDMVEVGVVVVRCLHSLVLIGLRQPQIHRAQTVLHFAVSGLIGGVLAPRKTGLAALGLP